jgi:hypothetical protein
VGSAALRVARICGFRYDEGRDAYILRLVGNRVGPPVDPDAAQIEWSDSIERDVLKH